MNGYSLCRPRGLAATSIARMSLISMSLLLGACTTAPALHKQAKPVGQIPPVKLPAVPSDDELALRSIAMLQARLYRVAAPLLMSNASLCKAHARDLLGFAAKNRYSYPSTYRSAAQKLLRLDDRLKVMDVLPGSGAAKAGLRPGDTLLSVEGRPLPEGEHAGPQAAIMLAPLVARQSTIRLAIQRNGHDATLNVPLTHACAVGMELGNTAALVALSDGYRILVSQGMMQFAGSDNELAYVLAKEIAHQLLSGRSVQKTDAAVGSLIDNLTRIIPDPNLMNSASISPPQRKLEVRTDRMALYMLARAGYPLDDIVPFLRRLAAPQPSASWYSYGAMHTLTPARIAVMEKALVELRAKQARRIALLP